MTIYLIRHGETDWNAALRFQGREDIPLNRAGAAQALACGRALAHSGLCAVYTSPLQRAVATGQIIAAEAKLPFTGLKANADLKYLGFGNSNYMDAKAKLTYDVMKGLGVEAGYRYQKLKLDKFDVDADVTFKGPFVGLNYNF